jgi:hypothetical protein
MYGVSVFGSVSELTMTIYIYVYTLIGPFYGKLNHKKWTTMRCQGALSSGKKDIGWPNWYMLANYTPNRPQACFSHNEAFLIWSSALAGCEGNQIKSAYRWRNDERVVVRTKSPSTSSWWMCHYVNLAINGWNIGHQKSCRGWVLSGCV